MDLRQELLAGNKRFAKTEWDPADADLPAVPSRRLAVLACMDTRHHVERVLGLDHGDAKIVRTAGNLVDDGALRSLIVAVHLLGVRHIAVMGHTKCGMTEVGRGDFRIARSISAETDVPLQEVMKPDFQRWLGGFADVEENVRRGVAILKNHPYMPPGLDVFGLVYDNSTGLVAPVDDVPVLRA